MLGRKYSSGGEGFEIIDSFYFVTTTVSATRVRAYGGRGIGWVRHWYNVARIKDNNKQVSVYLSYNDR